jgi:secretion/DNA translocation related TadE-like protein
VSRRPERGAATVLVVALSGLLMVVGLAVAGVTSVVVAHRGAQSAADLAALAGAQAEVGGDDGCAVAQALARANRARLTGCAVLGSDVLVQVSRSVRPGFGLRFGLEASARAGPG